MRNARSREWLLDRARDALIRAAAALTGPRDRTAIAAALLEIGLATISVAEAARDADIGFAIDVLDEIKAARATPEA